jgi:hypothetical protein
MLRSVFSSTSLDWVEVFIMVFSVRIFFVASQRTVPSPSAFARLSVPVFGRGQLFLTLALCKVMRRRTARTSQHQR